MSRKARAVIVTGAAGGIGSAICARLRRDGFWLVGVDQRDKPVDSCEELVGFDLDQLGRSDAAASAAADELRRVTGDRAVHGLVHAAAVQAVGDLASLNVEEFWRTMSVNLMAPYALTRAMAPDLRASRGAVVFITSIHARLTKPGFTLYATSKAALTGLTRSLALELAPDVRVNAVSPAATDTGMLRAGFGSRWSDEVREQLGQAHPLGRIATPDEVAAVVGFLLSPDASFMTSSIVDVGGGIHTRLHDIDE